jgi:hypothetical protein
MPVPDPALWITWYDLPEKGRDEYLEWLHGSYMPRQLERPGICWAAHYAAVEQPLQTAKKKSRRYAPAGSVPGGYSYMLLFGGESAHVFARPTPRQVHAQMPDADRKLLALRMGEAVNIMVEQARIDGADAARREAAAALSPCIQLGSFIHDNEEELLEWYAQWRMPSMTTLPGCVGVRKLVSVCGWAKHAILHEFFSLEARNENFVDHERKRHPDKAAWSEAVTGQVIHYPGSPNVARRLCSLRKG